MGSKGGTLIYPIIAAIMYVWFTIVVIFMGTSNVPTKWSWGYKSGMNRDMQNLLALLKVEIIALFFFIEYYVALLQPLPV